MEKIDTKEIVAVARWSKYFQDWEEKTIKQFRKKTGKSTHYKGKLTTNYKNYLKNLINLGKSKK